MTNELRKVEAIVLAAGQSRRMGQPKILLPWGTTTVLGQILSVIIEGGASFGLNKVIVVSGGTNDQIVELTHHFNPNLNLQVCFNPRYLEDEMLESLQYGMDCLSPDCQAILVALGDQPQIIPETVQNILMTYQNNPHPILMPSYQMHRGHPWLVDRALFPALKDLQPPLTLRDFFKQYTDQINYVLVDTPTILEDLDTPEDYQRYRPKL